MNFPVGGKAYIHKIYKANPFLERIYTTAEAEGSYIGKRDLERMRIHFPAGPRYKMFHYNLPVDFFECRTEPSGPDIIDACHAAYIANYKGELK